jgi:hypothetical protein
MSQYLDELLTFLLLSPDTFLEIFRAAMWRPREQRAGGDRCTHMTYSNVVTTARNAQLNS